MKNSPIKVVFTIVSLIFAANNISLGQNLNMPSQDSQPAVANQSVMQNRVMVDPGQPTYVQPAPKLGFQGQMIFGYGMKVASVNWGSAAQRAGLEAGDIIMEINGRPIRSQWDYNQALTSAANYNHGNIHMKVRNVRYDWGHPVPMFAYVNTVLDGFGPVGPIQPQFQSTPQTPASPIQPAANLDFLSKS